MNSGPGRTVNPLVAYRRTAGWLALAFVAVAASAAQAAEVALYRATVPLKGTTEADRNAAFGEALRAVVVRASGQRDAGSNPGVNASAGRANRLVQQYSATPEGELKVGFDAPTIDEILRDAGLPFWPSERPVTLVVMSGVAGADALRVGDASPERAQLELAAKARGVPLVWPLAGVSIETVRAQLEASGVEAIARTAGTEADAVLIGVLTGSQADWTLLHAGDASRRRGSAADGAHLAADTFADIYAPASTRGLSTATVRIGGVESLQAYAGLLDELDSLSMVRGIGVGELDGATVRLSLTLRGDLELLRRIAMLTPRLRPASGGDPGAPQFVYLP
jgi:uncharacterized protein